MCWTYFYVSIIPCSMCRKYFFYISIIHFYDPVVEKIWDILYDISA